MNELLAQLPEKFKKLLIKKTMPTFVKPMLATLTSNYFSKKGWIYERKFDGIRGLIFKNGSKYCIKSRNDQDMSSSYPELVNELKKTTTQQLILDGEIVSFKGSATSFEKMQRRAGVQNPSELLMKEVKVYIYIFDILYLDGYDLTKLPLIQRKKILKQAITFTNKLRYTAYRNTKGLVFFKEACEKDWEGLIAKEAESSYVHTRSQNWLKFKCIEEQELVVGGYTDPQASRIGFGALLVGYYKNGVLHYAGKVGTGYSDAFLKKFSRELHKIKTILNPFKDKEIAKKKGVHFVKPLLVVQIGFEEWTKQNRLRQPRFLGVRRDKSAQEVEKEMAKNIIPDRDK